MSASAPSNGEDSTLAIKCMDFCHALASQGMAFSFSLSVGSGFSFSLDAREKKKATSVATEEVKKKKLSPSKVRRNAKRRQEFLKRKSETSDKGNLGTTQWVALQQWEEFLALLLSLALPVAL